MKRIDEFKIRAGNIVKGAKTCAEYNKDKDEWFLRMCREDYYDNLRRAYNLKFAKSDRENAAGIYEMSKDMICKAFEKVLETKN